MKSRDPLSGISVFMSLSESLNFSKTASDIGLSKATVTTQLKDLEDRLGVRLLQRNTRNVTLTEAGVAYKDALSGMISQAKQAEREARSYQEGSKGTIRLSVSPDLGQQYIGEIIGTFIRDHPDISVVMDLSLEPVDLIEKGFDLAIRGTMDLDDNLIVRKLASCSLMLCASPDYLARSKAISVPSDLPGHSVLHFIPLRWGRSWQFAGPDDIQEVAYVTPRLESNDSISLREAACAGAGLTLLPEYVVNPDLRAGKLVHVLPDWRSADLPIHAVYPANRHIAAKVRLFVSVLAKALSIAFNSHSAGRKSPAE